MSDVKFEGAPKDGRSKPFRRTIKHDYWKIADQLREHPNEWALCFKGVPVAIPNAIRRGVRALPRDEFLMMTTNNTATPPRTCDVHLMYVPKKQRKPQL
jgi:hypothetical protein